MKRTVALILVCLSLIGVLSACGNSHEKNRKEAIAYAENNLELLKSCAQELQVSFSSELDRSEPTYFLAYKIEQQESSKLRLYNWAKETESEFHSELCQTILNEGYIKQISLHYNKGIWSIEFWCKSYGVGSSTGYCEIQCISSDSANDLWFYDDTLTYVEQTSGFYGQSKNEDNTFFYCKIADGVYYTEATF